MLVLRMYGMVGAVDFAEFILATVLLLFISLHRASLRGPLVSTTVYVAIPSLSLVPFSLSFQFFNKILPPGYPIQAQNV